MGGKRQKAGGVKGHRKLPAFKGSKPSGVSKSKSKSKPQAQPSKTSKPATPHKQTQQQYKKPVFPFSSDEQILLVGEGDLSFARSLVEQHGCEHVTATVFETSAADLIEKYPQAEENISLILAGGGNVVFGVDATKMKPWMINEAGDKVKKAGKGMIDRIFFNFPHVGGKSTDINRQVRYNQELLVSFFKQAIPSMSPRHGSSIIVTLFEGEPYTLWNVKDLARHSNLQVAESFRFQATAYPGYKHARTLGVVKDKNGESGGGWKGEDRAARSYVFVRKGEGVVMGDGKKKKGGNESSSEDEDEDEVDKKVIENEDGTGEEREEESNDDSFD